MTVVQAHYGRRSRSMTRPAKTTLGFLHSAGGQCTAWRDSRGLVTTATSSPAGPEPPSQEGFGQDGRIGELTLRHVRGRGQDPRCNLSFPIVFRFTGNRPERLTGRGFAIPLVTFEHAFRIPRDVPFHARAARVERKRPFRGKHARSDQRKFHDRSMCAARASSKTTG